MAELTGAQIIAKSLKTQGVQDMFGLVGVPVVPISIAAQQEGIRFVGTRHEQAAAYAAQAAAYIHGRISAALVVSGPGMTNAITALGNAEANCWPMILLGGASNLALENRGDFQVAPQVEAARPFVKYSARATDPRTLPVFIATAVREAISGRPGPVYIDLPGDVIDGKVDEDSVQWEPAVADPRRTQAADADVKAALDALKSASNPLVIVGKGAAWSRAENEVREFIDKTQIPFIPTPQAKGVVPDDHPLNMSAARTNALRNCDVVFLLAARFNWILHFGKPPRWREDLRVVQLDIEPEEIGTNVPTEAPLIGDAKAIMTQLNTALDQEPWEFPNDSEWVESLRAEVEEKRQRNEESYRADDVPMGYYRPLKIIDDALPRDAIFVCEGENTMGVARTVINTYEARARLDAGTWGTMGVGPGFALGAAVANPGKRVLALEGDAAFGFGPGEVETSARHKLPITWVIFNNNGIGGGIDEIDYSKPIPPNILLPGARYEKIGEAFGMPSYYCETPQEVEKAMAESMASEGPTFIHVKLASRPQRHMAKFAWLTRE